MRIESRPLLGRSGHLAGRELLEQMYRDQTGQAMPPILISQAGKPYFSQGDLHFSISHTRNHVFCALHTAPVGIDAEELDRPIRAELAKKLLSAGEYRQWQLSDDPQRALLTFWVLKEAQGKFLGTGLQLWPDHTNFSLDDPRVTVQNGCLVAVITEENGGNYAI